VNHHPVVLPKVQVVHHNQVRVLIVVYLSQAQVPLVLQVVLLKVATHPQVVLVALHNQVILLQAVQVHQVVHLNQVNHLLHQVANHLQVVQVVHLNQAVHL